MSMQNLKRIKELEDRIVFYSGLNEMQERALNFMIELEYGAIHNASKDVLNQLKRELRLEKLKNLSK